jgi:hypothetical protein
MAGENLSRLLAIMCNSLGISEGESFKSATSEKSLMLNSKRTCSTADMLSAAIFSESSVFLNTCSQFVLFLVGIR